MKAEELRIGNYISTSYMSSSTLKVTAIHSDRVCFESVTHDFKSNTISSYIEPIPLTEEWLLKFGFNNEYKKGWIGKDVKHPNGTTTDFVLSYPERMGIWQDSFAFEYDSFRFVALESVHQLQNLYFALTGEELKIQ
jgi:hypothetical protein